MRFTSTIATIATLVPIASLAHLAGCSAEVRQAEPQQDGGLQAKAVASASSGPAEPGIAEKSSASASTKQLAVSGWTNTTGSPTLAALRGKPVVVEFWATWCPPCVKSTPHLVKTAERYADQGLVVLGIHSSRGAKENEKIAAFIERFKMPYAVGLDTAGATGKAWGVRGIPAAFVFDRAGAEIWSGHPANEEFNAAVARAVGSGGLDAVTDE